MAFTVPVAAFKLPMTARVWIPAAMFGQQNDEVLGELGYSHADIERFRAASDLTVIDYDG